MRNVRVMIDGEAGTITGTGYTDIGGITADNALAVRMDDGRGITVPWSRFSTVTLLDKIESGTGGSGINPKSPARIFGSAGDISGHLTYRYDIVLDGPEAAESLLTRDIVDLLIRQGGRITDHDVDDLCEEAGVWPTGDPRNEGR